MNPIKLTGKLLDGNEASVWSCGICHVACYDELQANECCRPKQCACGEIISLPFYTACEACRRRVERDKEQAAFDKAKKVKYSEYSADLLLYHEGNGEYYNCDDDLFDDLDEDEDKPEWVWGTVRCKPEMSASDIIKNELENNGWYLDATNDVGDLSELQAALDKVCSKIPPSYDVDYSTVVLLGE